jgi:asparagine synthetase B (glutamine-hydrolysing)
MCVLIAAWDPAGLTNAPLAAALGDLRHRGPDTQASIWREDHRLLLAHARLKIIDTTDGASQPSWKQSRELCFIDTLPRTSNGKLQRRKLKQLLVEAVKGN